MLYLQSGKIDQMIKEQVSIAFYNVQGQKVHERTISAVGNHLEYFNLSNLSSGVYLVKVISDSNQAYKRLVIR